MAARSFLAAAGCVVVAALSALVPGLAPPASAQALPSCGAEQMEPVLENLPRLMYAGHSYDADLRFETGSDREYHTPVNVQMTGPPGVLRKVSIDGEGGQLELAPQAAGTLTLTVKWARRSTGRTDPDVRRARPSTSKFSNPCRSRSTYSAAGRREIRGMAVWRGCDVWRRPGQSLRHPLLPRSR